MKRSVEQRHIPRRHISLPKQIFYYLMRFPISLFFHLLYRVRFYGSNNLPETGGVLVVCNHQSYFDPPLIGAGLRRQLNYLARKSLFNSPVFAWLIRVLDAIPLDVNGIGFDGIKESLKRLRGGEVLLIFPEGGRTFDGQITEFKEGALTLAQRSQAAILPAALDGCFQAWNRKNKMPYPLGKIRVIFGKPLLYEEFKDLSEAELRHLIENKIGELFAELKNKKG